LHSLVRRWARECCKKVAESRTYFEWRLAAGCSQERGLKRRATRERRRLQHVIREVFIFAAAEPVGCPEVQLRDPSVKFTAAGRYERLYGGGQVLPLDRPPVGREQGQAQEP
jgi:hypothetical protein